MKYDSLAASHSSHKAPILIMALAKESLDIEQNEFPMLKQEIMY